MTSRSKKPVQPVTKPYLTGASTEERTWKSALGFFGKRELTEGMEETSEDGEVTITEYKQS